MDPRLAAHGAAFWGWSDDEELGQTTNLQKHGTIIDDMRDDGDDLEESEGDSDASPTSSRDSDSANDEEIQEIVQAASFKSSAVKAPQIVVFEDRSKQGPQAWASLHEFKAFMSARVDKMTKKTAPHALSKKEVTEERELEQNDRELNDLIKASRLIEDYAAEELTGRERRKYQLHKLEQLGMTASKEKGSQPFRMGIRKRDETRERKALEQAKLLGLDGHAVKTNLTSAQDLIRNASDRKKTAADSIISFGTFGKKKVKMGNSRARREAGLKGTNLGKFKNGMLTLSKVEIRRVQQGAIKKKGIKGKGGR